MFGRAHVNLLARHRAGTAALERLYAGQTLTPEGLGLSEEQADGMEAPASSEPASCRMSEEKAGVEPTRDRGSAAHRTTSSASSCDTAFDFAGRLIAAAVDERHLIGTAEAPHEWLRWAPQW